MKYMQTYIICEICITDGTEIENCKRMLRRIQNADDLQ